MTKQFLIFVGYNVDFKMLKAQKIHLKLLPAVLFLLMSLAAGAQEPSRRQQAENLVQKGDSLRAVYRFDESLSAYESALSLTDDTLFFAVDSSLKLDIQDRVLMSENGKSMAAFVDVPSILARRKFSLEDFFLYYPLADSSWRAIPNQLDSASGHKLARALFARDEARTLYWSAKDSEGIRNIYTSTLRDTLWALPSLLNEQMTSASDEIYPMLSPDGKSLFFSSAGLYGVGGYDIYVSRWNDDSNDWDAPVNMGFPYSSPADDFLYVDSEDGRYSVFASNRDCSADSVWVYVLEFNNVPVRRAVESPEELLNIAQLKPYESSGAGSLSNKGKTAEIQSYMHKLAEVKSLRDSVAVHSALAAEGKGAASLLRFKDMLSSAQGQLQKIEVEMMMKGVVLDPDKLTSDEGSAPAEQKEYAFVRKNMGKPLTMAVEVPEVKFDYSFKVLDVAQFAEDQAIPSGLVYQIQIFAAKKKAALKSLKGLSPVYEVAGSNGHIVYRVGLFRTYSDVLSHLNTVKKVGFRNAFIVAFLDGKSLTVAKARAKEKEKPAVQDLYEVRMVPSGGELDPNVAAGIRQQAAGKDIAKRAGSDGSAVYVVGPFADKAKAEDLALFVKAMGVEDVKCNVIRK